MQASALSGLLVSTKPISGAPFTVQSLATGKDYTFEIYRTEFKGKLYTHVKVETGYMEFQRVGTYRDGFVFNQQKMPTTTHAGLAISWLLRKVEEQKFDLLAEKVQIYHLGKCLRCGRSLTDATSIEIGLGPICREL